MNAFRLAKEATLRALDSPMDGRRQSEVVAPPTPGAADSSSSSRDGGSSVLPGARKEGVRVVKVQAHARRGVDGDGIIRSRL